MLLTKLHIPSPGSNIVHRLHLIEKLNSGLKRKLILVSAPAGFGKTTLICDWLDQTQVPAAWVSLDRRDNEPTEFIKNVNPTNDLYFKSEVEKMGIACKILKYGEELNLNN